VDAGQPRMRAADGAGERRRGELQRRRGSVQAIGWMNCRLARTGAGQVAVAGVEAEGWC